MSRVNEGKIESTEELGRASDCATGTGTHLSGSALQQSAGSSQGDWTGRSTYLLDRFLSDGLQIRNSLLESRPPHSRPEAANSETRMTLGVPMPYIVHNEGKVSYIVQIICDSFRWSY